jgi:DNA-binding MarR family transcriptional regulator
MTHGLDDLDYAAEHRVGHLLRRAYYRAKNNTNRLLKGLGVTPMQAAALMTLHRGTLSQADLGRAIGMEPANVHGLVARLKKLGFIDVESHPTDQRQVRVALSEKGDRSAVKLAQLSAQSAEETLARLAPAERETLMHLLGRIALE